MMRLPTLVAFPFDPVDVPAALARFHQEWQAHGTAIFYAQNIFHQLPPHKDYLSPEELKELNLMSSSARQQEFLTSRWLLKTVLSELLKCPAQTIVFKKGTQGKPTLESSQLVNPSSDMLSASLSTLSKSPSSQPSEQSLIPLSLDFNISHKASISLIGITHKGQIGLDVEEIDAHAKILKIAERYFQAPELAWVRQDGLGIDIQTQRFYKMWSLKEAIIKTVGGGVFQNLSEFYLEPSSEGFTIKSSVSPWNQSSQWNLFNVELPPKLMGSACIFND